MSSSKVDHSPYFTSILFDWDDTLVDSLSARVTALDNVFKQHELTDIQAEEFLHDLKGTLLEAALLKLQNERGIKDSLFNCYRINYWTKPTGGIWLYPSVIELLDTLKSRGFNLGIVTQKGRDFEFQGCRVGVMKELEELGITGLFSVIVGFEDVPEPKPDPSGMILALSTLRVQPQETLFVGDSLADIKAARAAGCWCCHATWGITGNQTWQDIIRADFTAVSPDDIVDLVCPG